MVFCPLIAAVALQTASADATDVQIVNRRPSAITSKLTGDLVPAGCKIEAIDERSEIRLHGDAQWRAATVSYIHMFDVKPQTVQFAVRVQSVIDKTDYRLELQVPDNQSLTFSEDTTGLHATVRPRINGDGTITLSFDCGFGNEKVHTIVRVKNNEHYVFCHGPHGSYNRIGDLAKHPQLIDPVVTISPSIMNR
jgi:hypothetical protein